MPEMISPWLVCGIGTFSCLILRGMCQWLIDRVGDIPAHVVPFGVDTTAQGDTKRLTPLDPEKYLNLSLKDGLQEKLARLETDPEYRDWFPLGACRLRLGSGAGSIAAIAKYLWNENRPSFESQLKRAVSHLKSGNRLSMANAANEMLRPFGVEVGTVSPVDVLYAAGTTGGTVGMLLDHARATKACFEEMGIAARFHLYLILPAVAGVEEADLARLRRNAYGRLQELSDQNARERLFDYLSLIEPPSAADLEDCSRMISELFARMVLGEGKVLNDKAIDMLPVHLEKGPFGQPKMFDTVRLQVLKPTPYSDPFAAMEAKTARELLQVEPSSILSRPSLLSQCGLTGEVILKPFQITPPSVPDWLNDGNVDGFLPNYRRQLESASETQLQKRRLAIRKAFESVKSQLAPFLQSQWTDGGPQGAWGALRSERQAIAKIKCQVQQAESQERARNLDGTAADIKARIKQEQEAVNREAYGKLLEFSNAQLNGLDQALCAIQTNVETVRDVLKRLERDYEAKLEGLAKWRPHCVPVLSEQNMDHLAKSLSKKRWQQEFQALELKLAVRGADADSISHEIRAKIGSIAQAFKDLNTIETALRVGGQVSERKVEAFAKDCAPIVRLDSAFDPRIHSSRRAFVSVPEGHRIHQLLSQSGRKPESLPHHSDEVVLISVDFGIEIGALVATTEVVQADCAGQGFPPFADRNYRPKTDLLTARPEERYATIALAVHRHLETGGVTVDELKGWCYDGVCIGPDRYAALEELKKRDGRREDLPSFADVSDEVERQLLSGRSAQEVVVILKEIEVRLTRHLQQALGNERFVVSFERSTIRVLIADLEKRIADFRNEREIWSREKPVPENGRVHVEGGHHAF